LEIDPRHEGHTAFQSQSWGGSEPADFLQSINQSIDYLLAQKVEFYSQVHDG